MFPLLSELVTSLQARRQDSTVFAASSCRQQQNYGTNATWLLAHSPSHCEVFRGQLHNMPGGPCSMLARPVLGTSYRGSRRSPRRQRQAQPRTFYPCGSAGDKKVPVASKANPQSSRATRLVNASRLMVLLAVRFRLIGSHLGKPCPSI